MTKPYILGANVRMRAPYTLCCFEDHDVVLPLAVPGELDGLKRAQPHPTGITASCACRLRRRASVSRLRWMSGNDYKKTKKRTWKCKKLRTKKFAITKK